MYIKKPQQKKTESLLLKMSPGQREELEQLMQSKPCICNRTPNSVSDLVRLLIHDKWYSTVQAPTDEQRMSRNRENNTPISGIRGGRRE